MDNKYIIVVEDAPGFCAPPQTTNPVMRLMTEDEAEVELNWLLENLPGRKFALMKQLSVFKQIK